MYGVDSKQSALVAPAGIVENVLESVRVTGLPSKLVDLMLLSPDFIFYF